MSDPILLYQYFMSIKKHSKCFSHSENSKSHFPIPFLLYQISAGLEIAAELERSSEDKKTDSEEDKVTEKKETKESDEDTIQQEEEENKSKNEKADCNIDANSEK